MATWRVGRKLGRTIYKDDVCIGMVDTPELAEEIVWTMASQSDEELARVVAWLRNNGGGETRPVGDLFSIADALERHIHRK
jgi:hypothetical protein